MRLISTKRLTRSRRLTTSSSTNKETDVNTPVQMTRVAAVAANAKHMAHMKKGIRFARSLPANRAGCANALHVTDIVLLQNLS